MAKVDFLGIGVLKGATTTLYDLIKTHPQVHLPENLKEVRFFDTYYDRGTNWYESLFSPNSGQICGEITPDYIYDPRCAPRIAEHFPEVKLLLLLRDPIRRTYSQYTHFRQERGYRHGFDQFLQEHPNATERNLYGQQIALFHDYFPKSQLKTVLFEDFVQNQQETMNEIFSFLAIQSPFTLPSSNHRANATTNPKFPRLYALGSRTMERLYRSQLTPVAAAIKKTGIKQWMLSGKEKMEHPPMSQSAHERLLDAIGPDLERLDRLVDLDFREKWHLKRP